MIQLHSVIVNFRPRFYMIIFVSVHNITFLKPLRNSLAQFAPIDEFHYNVDVILGFLNLLEYISNRKIIEHIFFQHQHQVRKLEKKQEN